MTTNPTLTQALDEALSADAPHAELLRSILFVTPHGGVGCNTATLNMTADIIVNGIGEDYSVNEIEELERIEQEHAYYRHESAASLIYEELRKTL